MKKITLIKAIRIGLIVGYYSAILTIKRKYAMMFHYSRVDACKAMARLIRMKHGIDTMVSLPLLIRNTADKELTKGVFF